MKKSLIYTTAIFLTLIYTCKPYHAQATHASGGEITYEWLSDSTYRFFFTFYRDCTGILEGTTQPLCFYNSCNSSTFTIALAKWPGAGNGDPVNPPCLGLTTCTSPTSQIPGYREWVYYGIATMPSQCSDWKIFTYVSDRNPSVNLQNATAQTFYVETHMNNAGALQGNSSPFFTTKPLPYVCLNQPAYFNNGAVDPDGDSLVTEMVMPQVGIISCNTSPVNATFATGSPVYALPANPIQTNNTFVLHPTTGTMTFTPTLLGPAAMAVRVKEYRNGVLIGSIVREMEAQVINCGPPPPITIFTLLPGNQVVNGTVHGCPGQPVDFCFNAKSPQSFAVLKMYDDHNAVMPGSTVYYTGMLTDSVTGCFHWVPPANTFGSYILSILVVDSTCMGSMPSYLTFTVPVFIGKKPSIHITAAPDTNVLSGTPVTFTATTTDCSNGTYQWKKNGVDITGATGSTWTSSTISNMDTITCALHCNDTCASVKDTISNMLVMHVFTSVKGASSIRSVSLYPNPNSGAFTLSGFAVKDMDMQLQLVNMLGQVVWSRQYTTGAGSFSRQVTTGSLEPGIYSLRIKTADGMEVKQITISR